ncbi:RCC1 and BTB domain-containing protein 2-like [Dermatophagoides farinae]|uniref:RCC1 and BTB domain-containing protein 2-like n=1 Tax=Dermatophagoides farinae TaxID=6954 RepID=UPI003F62D3C8
MIFIDYLENVELISCGFDHNFSITNKGEIYSWGLNSCGQLGLGDERNRNTPCLVSFPNDDLIDIRIKDIVAGNYHSIFLFENGQLWGFGSNRDGELGLGDKNNRSNLTKIPIENVQKIACSKFHLFSLAHDGSSYYAWGSTKYGNWLSSRKLDGQPASFSAASAMILESPITFGLTSKIKVFQFQEPISTKSIIRLFNNPDNYDVKFVIGDRRILACKCYLKSVSDYYCLMFSGAWKEKVEVEIRDYSYETYYAYLRMLHYGCIGINQNRITQLIDLATCYIDKRLMKHCKTFIRDDLDEQTMPTYLPLVIKYEIKELYDKLSHITIEQVLPKVTDSILQNNENSIEFLDWFYNQRRPFIPK